MKHNMKRAFSVLLAVLMCLSMLTGIVLPASAADTTAPSVAERFAAIKATDEDGDGVFTPAANVVFVNPSFGTGTFTYKYGDGTTWGNGVTYELTIGVNAYAKMVDAVLAVQTAWNAANTTVADYTGIDTVVIAPGTYSWDNWQPNKTVMYDLPTDFVKGNAYDKLFTVNFIGPQAGLSPATDAINHADPAAQNGRSDDPTKEAVSTGTMWEPKNAYYIVDGMAFAKSHNFYGGHNETAPYTALTFKNIYHHVNEFYSSGVFRFGGWSDYYNSVKQSRYIEFTNYYMEYAQLADPAKKTQTPTGEMLIGDMIVFDNFYEDFTAVEYISDQHSQGYMKNIYLTPSKHLVAGFAGEGVNGAHLIFKNSVLNNHATSHFMRFKFNNADISSTLKFTDYESATKDSLNVTFENNLFYNCGDTIRSIYNNNGTSSTSDDVVFGKDPATTADPAGYTDTISFQDDWAFPASSGALHVNFRDNTLEYTLDAMNDAYNGNGGTKAKTSGGNFFTFNENNLKDINSQSVTWNMYDNTLIYPSEASLTSRIYLMAASHGNTKNNAWDFSHLMLNEKGEVCTFWPSYHLVNDLYAGDDFSGGVKELFTVVDGAEMAIVENDIVLRAANAANGLPIAGFNGTLMIVPEADAATYDIKDLFKFRGEKVEVVKLLNPQGGEVTGKVNPNDLDGYKIVARYMGKTTTCTVTLTISIAPESEYAFIDPTGTATEYTFNGKTYALDDSNRFTALNRLWNTSGSEISSSYKSITAAKKSVIVFMPGEHKITATTNKGVASDNFQFQVDAAILGPQFGVSPVADDFSLNVERDGLKKVGENNYTVDTAKEAYITGGCLNVYNTETAVYVDGISFKNFEINLQAASFDWGLAKNGSLTSITMNNCFVNGWDNNFIGAWSDSHLNMIAKQALYVSDLYAAGLGAQDNKSLINIGAANVEIDHIYVENKKTNCLFRTKGSNGKRMLIHPQIATFELTDSKMAGIDDTYNFIYPNFASSTANGSWQGTPFSADPEYYPGGFKILYDNNIFENCYSATNPAKDYMIRSATPNTTAYMASIFTNNTIVYDTALALGAKHYFYQPSMEGDMVEHVLSGNKFINANANSNLYVNHLTTDGEKVDISENYWAVIEDGVEKLIAVKSNDDRYATKSDWYYIDRAMTTKNTDVELVDNGYKAFTAGNFDGVNNVTIDASESKLTGDVKAFFKAEDGAAVEGVYSDAACTKAVTELSTGDVYVNVVKGDAALATKVALTVCAHEGTTSEDVTDEPGCATEGSKTISCSVCDKSWIEKIPATGKHNFTVEVEGTKAEPTCSAAGSVTMKCADCAATEDKTLEIDPDAHVWDADFTIDTPAGCNTPGSKSIHCSLCTATKDVTAVEATGKHLEDTENVVVDTPASCGTAGVGHTVCSDCGTTVTENVVIEATGKHIAGELIVDTAATCVATGLGHKDCTVCKQTVESNIVIDIDVNAHVWNTEYTVDLPATCYTEGAESIHCSLCTATKDSKAIAATGDHTPADEWTQGEETHYHACTTNGCPAKLDEVAHTESDVIEITAPQIGVDGVGKTECTVCGKVLKDNVLIPALPAPIQGGASIGDKNYESLEAALADAKAGDVITMNEDAEINHLALDPEVVLDLNGNELTTEYAIGFNTSAIIDNSEDNSGKLIVDKDKVALDHENDGFLPVYDGEGYIFVEIGLTNRYTMINGNTYAFSPIFEDIAHKALLADYANSGIKIVVRLTWEKEDNYKATQDYIYVDAMVDEVIESFDGANYGKMFVAEFAGSEAGAATDVTVSAVIISDTGVEIASGSIDFIA